MTKQQPITPPTELVEQWQDESPEIQIADHVQYLMTRAAQWGADQELEACLWHLGSTRCNQIVITNLRDARRPKPPSLKEQALKALERQSTRSVPSLASTNDCDTIRLALEALPND